MVRRMEKDGGQVGRSEEEAGHGMFYFPNLTIFGVRNEEA